MEALRSEFAEFGVVRLPQLLDEGMLDSCKRAFDDATFAPKLLQSRTLIKGADGTKYYPNDASGHQGDHKAYQALFAAHPRIGEVVAQVLGSENLWYLDHEIWYKTGYDGSYNKNSMFHQDTLGFPAFGLHMANLWISFEEFTPAKNSLAVVKGTHKGPHYLSTEGASERNKAPLPSAPRREGAQPPRVHDGPPVAPGVGVNVEDIVTDKELRRAVAAEMKALPRLPADFPGRAESMDIARGDVLLVHPRAVHGGAPLSADHPERHTLVVRVFGDDCVYRPPTSLFRMQCQPGEHYSKASPHFFKIWGPGAVTSQTAAGAESRPIARL